MTATNIEGMSHDPEIEAILTEFAREFAGFPSQSGGLRSPLMLVDSRDDWAADPKIENSPYIAG